MATGRLMMLKERLGNIGVKAGSKAAIVQFEAVHEEVIPSVCAALKEMGITPTVFLNQEIMNRRGDLFATICPGEFDYHYIPLTSREDWDRLKARLQARQKDAFVLLNTFQRPGIVNFTAQLQRPVVGIVHNPEVFLSHPECREFAQRSDVGLVALADHAASYLIARDQQLIDRVATLIPAYWGARLGSPQAGTARRKVIVPGAVNFKNRNYDFIFDVLSQNAGLKDRIELRILGGGPDRAALEARVIQADLSNSVTFSQLDPATGFVSHDTYFDDLRDADFVLPLLPLDRQDYRVYKITAALSTAQGFAIPPLLDRWTGMVYRVPSVPVRVGGLSEALGLAADMTPAEYSALREELIQVRTRNLERNTKELSYLAETILNPI